MSQHNFSGKEEKDYNELFLQAYLDSLQQIPASQYENLPERVWYLEAQNKKLRDCVELLHKEIKTVTERQVASDENYVLDIASLCKRKFSILFPPMTIVEIILLAFRSLKTIVWAIIFIWGIKLIVGNTYNLDSIYKIIKPLISGSINP